MNYMGGWVGPQAALDMVGKRKILAYAWNRAPIFKAKPSHEVV
jgi:hypothetical protein